MYQHNPERPGWGRMGAYVPMQMQQVGGGKPDRSFFGIEGTPGM